MSARFSHAACSHPSTKVARAACRRQMAKLITAVIGTAAVVTEPAQSEILKGWYEMKAGPLELTAAPIKTAVTSENWREFKGQTVAVEFYGLTRHAEITGWSAKNIQLKTNSKTQRFPAEHVLSAAV